MEHEFLVVYAIHRSGARIVLGVDRNAERPSVAPKGAAPVSAKKLSLFPREAYDSVQVSHNGTPAPILQQHGRSVPLSFITFARTATATARSDDDADPQRPSLLHLSILLLTIRNCSPSYSLLQYQCYFFARATCLALIDLFDGEETAVKEGRRATWRGVHISSFSTALTVLFMIVAVDVAIVPAGLGALCNAAMPYDRDVVKSELDRERTSDEMIRRHEISHKHRAAWQAFMPLVI
ncbi:hypothetical protein BC826DRAFT_62056 [Russula brevipes]|nr:hypothetical protein BC826DRAFT_62056 [Russula brevipes]